MENNDLIQQALRYIRTCCGNPGITIEEVALHAGFSTAYFNRLFSAHTGFTVMEYVRFRRLKTALRLLRTTGRDILDIALECGYETHESFSRAFRKQYGRNPSEYRAETAGREIHYGDLFNDTTAAWAAHAFPELRPLDRDEVIDWMLETDALRYGYSAVCLELNKSAVFSLENAPEGSFLVFNEYPGEVMAADVFDRDDDRIARYVQMLAGSCCLITLFGPDDEETLRRELAARGIPLRGMQRIPEYVYTGQPYALTAPVGIAVRALTMDNADDFLRFAGEYGLRPRFVDYVRQSLHQRDVLGNAEHSLFDFLIYAGDLPVGLCIGGLQRVRNFTVNNCIELCLLDGWQREDICRYALTWARR